MKKVKKAAQGGMLKGKGEQMSMGPRDKGTPTPVKRKALGYKKGGQVCRGMGKATSGGRFGRDG
jgi:hypothetical protein